MSSARMSPGGALLRASRVFAIPKSLPRPTTPLSTQTVFDSDTATLPHPIHQSITTPQSSLAKGDWGFKRPLPLRATTRSSTPIIRVEAIDTFEQITEFTSAADHSLTLKKWQELNIPISTPRSKKLKGDGSMKHRSVFDDDIDTTVSLRDNRSQDDTRWKFSGPWLAGLTEGEFQTFVAKEVGRKKSEFREYLRESCALTLTIEARLKAQADGLAMGEVKTIAASEISEEELSLYIRRIRKDFSVLYRQIRAFLDLAPPPAPTTPHSEYYDELSPPQRSSVAEVSTSPYAESGPPKTHPSAGLFYGRHSNWIYNHALYGPQESHPPVEARIVNPKNASGGQPLLGVAGVVTNIPTGFPQFDIRASPTQGRSNRSVPGLLFVEPDKYGGSKTWVDPKHAYIDSRGKIVLAVLPAEAVAVAVKRGKVDEIPEPLQRKQQFTQPQPFSQLRDNSQQRMGSRERYGL